LLVQLHLAISDLMLVQPLRGTLGDQLAETLAEAAPRG
jgi:hypothetical protein